MQPVKLLLRLLLASRASRTIENRDRWAESDREVKKTNGLGYK